MDNLPPDIPDAEDTLLVREVMRICGVSRVTVHRWIKREFFRAHIPPTGKPARIYKTDFYDFLGQYRLLGARKEKTHGKEEDCEGAPQEEGAREV